MFVCSSNGQCVQDEQQGTCQPSGVCSFDDQTCPSGQRFGKFAGALTDTCVPVDDGTGTGAPTAGAGSTSTASDDQVADDLADDASDAQLDDGASDTTRGSDDTSGGVDSTTAEGSDGRDTTGDAGLADGEACTRSSQCASGSCYQLGILGGLCGECAGDVDCPSGGCNPSNPVPTPPVPSTCGDGTAGTGCQSSAACMRGLWCSVVIDGDIGMFNISTCGECQDDTDCARGQLCNLTANYLEFSGQHACVAPGSVANGGSCSLGASGDQACTNMCVAVSVMGLLELGVCGDCGSDDDCLKGGACQPGQVDPAEGIVSGATCN